MNFKNNFFTFFVLFALFCLIHPSSVTAQQLTIAERRERRKLINERRERAWAEEYRSAPQRKRKWKCFGSLEAQRQDQIEMEVNAVPGSGDSSDSSSSSICGWEGLQVALAEGEGLQACKDCTEPQLEGLYSK